MDLGEGLEVDLLGRQLAQVQHDAVRHNVVVRGRGRHARHGDELHLLGLGEKKGWEVRGRRERREEKGLVRGR